MELEHPLLKVPTEELQRQFRSTKRRVDKELDAVVAALSAAGRGTPPPPPSGAPPSLAQAAAARTAARALRDAASRLRGVQPRLADAAAAADGTLTTLCRRLGHLTTPAAVAPKHGPRAPPYPVAALVLPAPVAARRAWERTRLARLVVDYLGRGGHAALAARLASATGVGWLVDLDAYADARAITDALGRRDPRPLLRWCAANERRLGKAGSRLELRVRTQEFVELVRGRHLPDAIAYAKKHLVPGCLPHSTPRLLRSMALLAFPPDTVVAPYAEMYADGRWGELADAFREDYYALHGLARVAVLATAVKAGLAALKTRYCAGEPLARSVLAGDGETLVRYNVDCPACVEPTRSLAADLPYAFHLQSALVCALSRRPMDADNLPLLLPNGNVYSRLAILKAAEHGDGVFTDPRTGDTYEYPQEGGDDGRGGRTRIRRVYVM